MTTVRRKHNDDATAISNKEHVLCDGHRAAVTPSATEAVGLRHVRPIPWRPHYRKWLHQPLGHKAKTRSKE